MNVTKEMKDLYTENYKTENNDFPNYSILKKYLSILITMVKLTIHLVLNE